MTEDFLSQFMGNPARSRLLRVFALSPEVPFTMAQGAKRAGITLATAEREIRALEKLALIKKKKYSLAVASQGRKIEGKQAQGTWIFDAQSRHATAVSKFIHEVSPLKHSAIIEGLRRSGRLSTVVLSGTFVGDPTRPADLVVAVDGLNERRLEQAVRRLEPLYGREIRYAVFTTPEFRYRLTIHDRLLRDTLDFPHLVILDKTRLL